MAIICGIINDSFHISCTMHLTGKGLSGISVSTEKTCPVFQLIFPDFRNMFQMWNKRIVLIMKYQLSQSMCR